MILPTISTPILLFFRRIVRGYFRRHFHAVRIAHAERFKGIDGPLIVYANHSSWWDPMVSVLLAAELMPERRHYAPMDAAALEKYGILKWLGIFPVEMASARGAVQFLRTGEAVLESGGVLWVTPQGRFADPRERPLEFKAGMAALAARVAAQCGSCTLLPLAIEYPFWDERLPETLLCFADPVIVHAGEAVETVQRRSIGALEQALEALKSKAVARDPAAFELLTRGSLGTGGFYALGKRVKAFVTRRPYVPEHTPMQEMPK
ncbi:lysophospholipid acyltransferase family protein [Granulicella aggregans]|jgi:1-acyl-sn-glycerol-3-phosphate acyltransferase|uniref:lysophospholipid acyltransferase family protein n=1 Tax=Granulicella aggregans TaxID=474949 RepID=UPI0021DFA87A|nr:lysophospholipid acyltransferase family protein [Granulicella aggregans]